MARILQPATNAHRNQLESEYPFVWLYEIQTKDNPPKRYRMTNFTERLQFRGNLYYPVPIVHGGTEQNADGDLPTINFALGATSVEVISAFEQNDGFIGNPCRLTLLSLLELANPPAAISVDGEVVGATIDEEKIQITVAGGNLFRADHPGRRTSRRKCGWLFGSAECAYDIASGNYDQCGTKKDDTAVASPYTYEACEVVGADELATGQAVQHPERFGGFPAMAPAGRRF